MIATHANRYAVELIYEILQIIVESPSKELLSTARYIIDDVSKLLMAMYSIGLNERDDKYGDLVKATSRLLGELGPLTTREINDDDSEDEFDDLNTSIFNVDDFDRDSTRTSFVEDAIRVDLQEIVTLELCCLNNSKESWHMHQHAVSEIVPPLPPARSTSSSSARVSSPIRTPTKKKPSKRVRPYRHSLREVLRTEKQFSLFLQRELCGISEGLLFLVRVEKYRRTCSQQSATTGFDRCFKEARDMVNRYVDLDQIDTLEVLSDATRRVTRARLEEVRVSCSAGVTRTTEALKILVELFDPECSEIEREAMKTAYPKYLEWKQKYVGSE